MQESSPALRFGTDGIRGRAGTWPIDGRGFERLGLALAHVLAPSGDVLVVVGRDTRESGLDLSAALESGLLRGGAEVRRAGVLPTGALSCLVPFLGAQAGVMVTASHNPGSDNGAKVLGPDGRKLEGTSALEEVAARGDLAGWEPRGEARDLTEPLGPWRSALPQLDLRGRRIWLDAAHGAAAFCAPRELECRGAEVRRHGCAPDGRNINAGVGALHPPSPRALRDAGCDVAICLDGDADRLVLVDANAGQLDGDDMLWLLEAGGQGPVVGTILSNSGLERALEGRLCRAQVGDQHVAALMRETGARVGAEPSGHVLFHDGLPTGDGLYTALRVLAAVVATKGHPLPLPLGGWTRWPSAQQSVVVQSRDRRLQELESVEAARAAGNRVVVRYSGTEAVVRVLVEGRGEGRSSPGAWVNRIGEELLT